MLTLHNAITFGNFSRFKAYQYDKPCFDGVCYHLEKIIFVADAEQKDNVTGLPLIVFQEWAREIESLDQVIAIVHNRYPEAFVSLE